MIHGKARPKKGKLGTGSLAYTETHTKRQATQHGCLPRLLRYGDKGIEIEYDWGKIFCTGPTSAAKAKQKSLVRTRQGQRTNQGKTPIDCILWVPIHPSFNSQQGPPLSSLSGHSHETQIFYCPCKSSCAPSSPPAPFINIFLFNQKVKSVKVFQGNLIWGPVCVWGGGGWESADGNILAAPS